MWFLHDGTGTTLCCLSHGELTLLFLEPLARSNEFLKILLSRFRARTSDYDSSNPIGAVGNHAPRIILTRTSFSTYLSLSLSPREVRRNARAHDP